MSVIELLEEYYEHARDMLNQAETQRDQAFWFGVYLGYGDALQILKRQEKKK